MHDLASDVHGLAGVDTDAFRQADGTGSVSPSVQTSKAIQA
ncbi:MAG: hypothetical protein QNJ04_12145 [Desulfobacterales bacterium]|nr:hypothetical protein [Desulfobacterales bacterium]